ncbi:helix-turn-helix domain-containing protein [Nostoc sp.]|uniref:helix-turn-helix domain-containing protein n=1 Tax=Nostoc sp. TaxID=1180 RepID=UPI003FA59D09
MAKSYSYDFRQKVIQAIELDGLKKSEVSELFNISRNTINLWLERRARTGDFQANNKKTLRSDRKITDSQKFRSFVKMHGDKTQKEMAELWEDDISQRTISRALHKIGFTRKKRLMVTANAMNSCI